MSVGGVGTVETPLGLETSDYLIGTSVNFIVEFQIGDYISTAVVDLTTNTSAVLKMQIVEVSNSTAIRVDGSVKVAAGSSYMVHHPVMQVFGVDSSTTKLFMDSEGSVGFGTDTPKAMLDLHNGSVRLTGLQGGHYELANEEDRGLLTLHDGVDELLSIAQNTGAMQVRGDLSLGGEGTTGSRSLTIRSLDGGASLSLEAQGPAASAYLNVSVQANQSAVLELKEGENAFSITNDGVLNELSIDDGEHKLLTVKKSTGDSVLRGDLTVGGTESVGDKLLSVYSSDGAASVSVSSGGQSDAIIAVSSPESRFSRLELSEVSGQSYTLVNDGIQNALVLSDGLNELIKVAPTTGSTLFRGDLTIGGVTTGAKAATIRSSSGPKRLSKTGVSTAGAIVIPTYMNLEATLKVCFAAAGTNGDEAADFVELAGDFNIIQVQIVSNNRVAVGSGPHTLDLTGLTRQDQLYFSKEADCTNITFVTASSSTTASVELGDKPRP